MTCRHCDATVSLRFLDLGTAPPSNAFVSEARLCAPEVWYPLRLLVCTTCWLVQTEDYAGRDALFTSDYVYLSSISSSWLTHAERYVSAMVDRFALDDSHRIAEVAANDGYLLQFVQARGIPCYGIEPTASTAAVARARGIDIVQEFFGAALGARLADEGRQCDLIAANNVLAHVPDVNDFVAGFERLLTRTGVVTFEFPYLRAMVEHGQFDTAYHEHYSYFSLTAAMRILELQGLQVFDVEVLPTHGGSLRVFAQRAAHGVQPVSAAVAALLVAEGAAGIRTPSFYAGFQERAEAIKDGLLTFLIDARRRGRRVAAYGAAAKGNTLINFAGLKADLLPYVCDAAPSKQGRYLPGSRIPVRSPSVLDDERPDDLLILPWNIAEEVAQQLEAHHAAGMRFVTVIPTLKTW